MSNWKAKTCLHAEQVLLETEDIGIKNMIFQWHSSTLFFALALSLSQNTLTRYEENTIKTTLLLLIYLDDLEQIEEREEKLKTYLLRFGNVSDCIHTEFEFEKCAKIVPKIKILSLTNLVLDIITVLQHLEQGNTSKGDKWSFIWTKERNFQKGIRLEIKNDPEIRPECQEKYYSN